MPPRPNAQQYGKGVFMIPENRIRISCTIDRKLWDKIGELAELYGMPKAVLCAFWISQGYVGTAEALKAIKDLPVDYVKKFSEEK